MFPIFLALYSTQFVGTYNANGMQQMSVTITSNSTSPVVIGTTSTFAYTINGGQPPYTIGWIVKCRANEIATRDSPLIWCFKTEGTHEIKVNVIDANSLTATNTMNLTVNGPDNLEFINGGTSNPFAGAGIPMTVIHKFKARVGSEEVGPCWQCPNTKVYEYAVGPNGQPPGNDPEQWINEAAQNPDAGALTGCSSKDNPGFFWRSPYIVDYKTYIAPANFPTLPDRHIITTVNHWVAIKVNRCGQNPRFVILGPMLLKLRKNGNKVEWEN